jgi:hypothetical protein
VKKHTILLSLLVLSLALAAAPAMADSVLYSNGPYDDDVDAWEINYGFVVSDTFTLTGNATITGFNFNAWLFPGDVLSAAEVSLTSNEFGGTIYFDQTINFTQSNCSVNAYGYNACLESGHFSGPTLNAGTYWVNLQNAVVTNNDPVYWDENSGHGCNSPGCPSLASESVVGTIPSESFTLFGNTTTTTTTGTVPEPGAILLLGSGIVALAGGLRRKML